MSDQYTMASAGRCTVHPQHIMVNQGRSEQHYADTYWCSCGKRALGNGDEARARAARGTE